MNETEKIVQSVIDIHHMGTLMRSSLSVRIAEIVMKKTVKEINCYLYEKILFWRRYIDDVFFIAEDCHINNIFNFFNSMSCNIQFTLEVEVGSAIPFLDIFITKKLNSPFIKFSTSVHRKKTATGQCLNVHSINPISYKKFIIRTLLFGAYNYCDSENCLIEKEKISLI